MPIYHLLHIVVPRQATLTFIVECLIFWIANKLHATVEFCLSLITDSTACLNSENKPHGFLGIKIFFKIWLIFC